MKPEIALFAALSVVAITIAACASCAFVIHAFVPLSTHSSPTSFAVVDAAAASEPLPGSESPKQPSFSPRANGVSHSRFCSSVPKLSTGSQYSELFTDMITPVEAQPREISSIAIAYASTSIPVPPYSSGIATPISPSSPICATCAAGNVCSLSSWPAIGLSSLSAKSRHICRIISCSSARSSAGDTSASPSTAARAARIRRRGECPRTPSEQHAFVGTPLDDD